MAWFKRRSSDADQDAKQDVEDGVQDGDQDGAAASADVDADDAGTGSDVDAEADAVLAAAGRARRLEADRAARGPLDESEADADVARVDLGALRLPATTKLELRLEVQDTTRRVLSVTVALEGSALQMQAFAAPRTTGVWDDIRAEIATQVGKQGGAAEEVEGEFGLELVARVPVRTEDGRTGHRPSRFIGVDGPRWFLRGVLTGPAAHDRAAAKPLEELLRGVVVVRGTDARPPRELLPLTLPPNAQPPPGTAAAGAAAPDAAAQSTDDVAAARPRLTKPERGPESTETR